MYSKYMKSNNNNSQLNVFIKLYVDQDTFMEELGC